MPSFPRRTAFVLLAALGLGTGAVATDAPTASTPVADAPARTVLVTGANRGIGLGFAKVYADAGWNVIGTARTPEKATELAETGATIVQLDVTDEASIAKMAETLAGRPIDLLINNAGVIGERSHTLDNADPEDFERIVDVNLFGPMRVTKALLPNLRAGEGKTIVSISSGLASIEMNRRSSFYGYRESKAALNMFMRSLAWDLRDEGFLCIPMSPGGVRTDMGDPRAPQSPVQAATAMRRVIDGLTPEKVGRFWGHDGSELPW